MAAVQEGSYSALIELYCLHTGDVGFCRRASIRIRLEHSTHFYGRYKAINNNLLASEVIRFGINLSHINFAAKFSTLQNDEKKKK